MICNMFKDGMSVKQIVEEIDEEDLVDTHVVEVALRTRRRREKDYDKFSRAIEAYRQERWVQMFDFTDEDEGDSTEGLDFVCGSKILEQLSDKERRQIQESDPGLRFLEEMINQETKEVECQQHKGIGHRCFWCRQKSI